METKEKALEIEEYIDQNRLEELYAFILRSKKTIFRKWLENDFIGLETELNLPQSLLQFYREGLEERTDVSVIFELGTLLGTVESFRKLLYEADQEKRVYTQLVKMKRYSKYLQKAVAVLAVYGPMSREELAEHLELKDPALSSMTDSLLEIRYAESYMTGKSEVYSLSDAGIRYERCLRHCRNEIQNKPELYLREAAEIMLRKNRKDEMMSILREVISEDLALDTQNNVSAFIDRQRNQSEI